MQKRIISMQSRTPDTLVMTWVLPTLLGLATLALTGCANMGARDNSTYKEINAELATAAAAQVKPAPQGAVNAALLPPLNIEMPKVRRLLRCFWESCPVHATACWYTPR
jgi:hypothetical protein